MRHGYRHRTVSSRFSNLLILLQCVRVIATRPGCIRDWRDLP
jgi:hypothetical protein